MHYAQNLRNIRIYFKILSIFSRIFSEDYDLTIKINYSKSVCWALYLMERKYKIEGKVILLFINQLLKNLSIIHKMCVVCIILMQLLDKNKKRLEYINYYNHAYISWPNGINAQQTWNIIFQVNIYSIKFLKELAERPYVSQFHIIFYKKNW